MLILGKNSCYSRATIFEIPPPKLQCRYIFSLYYICTFFHFSTFFFKKCSLATSSERDRKLGRSLIPRYQTFGLKRLGQGTAASIEALSEVPDDQDEELMALNLVSEVETPSEASGGAR